VGGETPRALAFADGHGVLVTQDGGEPYSQATRHTITIPGGRPEGSVLKLVSRPDGGIPTHPHNARLGLRGVADLDLAVDVHGRLVAAATSPSAGLVVASLRSDGSVLQRQVRRTVSGLVQIALTREEADRASRSSRRASGADRPGRCFARRPATVWRCSTTPAPTTSRRMATSRPRQPFGTPLTLASDARADTAILTHDGHLVIGLSRKTTQLEVYSGALSALRVPGAGEPVSAGPAESPLVSRDRAGRAVLAWRAGATLQVSADHA
jgi:hypothetical protein